MNFDLMSDLHVDMNSSELMDTIKPTSDILVVAGDISNDPETSFNYLSEKLSKVYDKILFVDGNHEHYKSDQDVATNMEFFRKMSQKSDKIFYLDGQNFVKFGNTAFVGVCGWYDFNSYTFASSVQQKNNWKQSINDYKQINFGVNEPEEWAENQAYDLMNQVEYLIHEPSIENIVVATHTLPSVKVNSFGGSNDPLSGSFVNSFMRNVVISDDPVGKITNWVFGHTHYFCDQPLGFRIRATCNPRGYGFEDKSEYQPMRIDC